MLEILLMIILIIIIIILFSGLKIKIKYNTQKKYVKILILKKIPIYTIKLGESSGGTSNDIVELVKPVIKDIIEFLKKIKIAEIKIHLIIGFDNFADTGEKIGYIWAILAIINTTLPNTKISAEPSFTGEKLDINAKIELDISIIEIIKLLLKKNMRDLIWTILKKNILKK